MKIREFLSQVRQVITPPLYAEETTKRRAATISYLVYILIAASLILLVPTLIRKELPILISILLGDSFLILAMLLARRGQVIVAGRIIPIILCLLGTYLAVQGNGIHDLIVVAFPMIVVLGGMTQGKHGALFTAALGSGCMIFLYWATFNGFTTNSGIITSMTSLDDLINLILLLWITAAFTFFSTNSLIRSLESMHNGEQTMRNINRSVEQYASILEQRTEHLLTGARVSRAATSILDPDQLGQQVVDMVCNRFGLYYVGLFLVDENLQWANLRAGTGTSGKQMLENGHRLKIGSTSMIGWCISHKTARIALDVGNEAVRFENPLLPQTHSELALPLISRGEAIGALSIQSEKQAAFTDEDILSFQAMGDQLANAIRNAQLYEKLERELTHRRKAEKEVRKLNKDLEKRVSIRTAELQDANQRLVSLSRLKDEFLSNVSHELRTPITSIMLYHSMLETNPLLAQKYVNSLKRETNRLARLIEDLLYLSRLDQGRISVHPTALDLNRLIHDYATDCTLLASQRQLTILFEPDESVPHIQADEQMLGQVLSVLLTNALNYTPPEGLITIRTQAEIIESQPWAGFMVSDTGTGIIPEDRQRLFERFFRGQSGRESTVPGTGLGLSIAHEIIEKHSGRIEVQSEGRGKGATFSVWLPVEK